MTITNTEDCLMREDLEVICSEEGAPVASHEWDQGLEHGLRNAFGCYQDRLRQAEALAEAAEQYIAAFYTYDGDGNNPEKAAAHMEAENNLQAAVATYRSGKEA